MYENIERIQYLTKKAQLGAITPYEMEELIRLLNLQPQQFQDDPNSLNTLIGIALIVIIAVLIAKLLK